MSARKRAAASLRKGLQEDTVLQKRFATADSVVGQLRSVGESTPEAAPVTANGKPRQAPKALASQRMVRESISMPVQERQVLDDLVNILRKRGVYEVTRSQLLRAGIAKLSSLAGPELEEAIASVERGRPGRKPADA